MAIRKILEYPQYEKSLRKTSKPVEVFDAKVKKLFRDMKDTVKSRPAVGLAAPQIGVHRQVIVVRLGQSEDGEGKLQEPMVIVNPEILEEQPPVRGYDACLSIPDLYGYTNRPGVLRVQGRDEDGKLQEWTFEEMDARAVHHEIDHLQGVLFIDHIQDFNEDLFMIVEDEEGELEYVPFALYLAQNPEDHRWQQVMPQEKANLKQFDFER
jgi:peptide deformylase